MQQSDILTLMEQMTATVPPSRYEPSVEQPGIALGVLRQMLKTQPLRPGSPC
jgi:hypothetical protein